MPRPTAPTAPTAPPTTLGSYQLIRLLAHGGMADVYLARQSGLDRYVAIKVLNAQRAADPESCTLFVDEARVVGMLSHGNLAAVYDVDMDGGVYYLAMEYVHGADLREVLAKAEEKHTALAYSWALSLVRAAAAGLDHAHRRCGPDGRPLHLVHRDVSLSNVMVSHEGEVKVIDFGIATSAASVHTTSPGVVRGKAAYMAPEQCLGDPVDLRTDVFALGVVLYELTTGRRCFLGNSDFERMLAVVRGDYVMPTALVADFPVALENIIRTALSLDPAKRYASAAAMIEALDAVAAAEGWVLGTAATAQMMEQLFGNPTANYDDEPTMITEIPTPPHPPTRVITRRRLARGTESDVFDRVDAPAPSEWQDEVPTRGRRSLSRMTYRPLAAA